MIHGPPSVETADIAMALPIAAAAQIAGIRVAPQPGLWRWSAENVLGTKLDILAHSVDGVAVSRAAVAIRAEIDRLDQVLSAWREDSELSTLNRLRSAIVSPDLFQVLKRAEEFRALTAGVFDARIGAALAAWRQGAPAGPVADLAAPLLDAATRMVTRPNGVVFELDGIAKGYILDLALAAARKVAPTLSGLLVNIGGDIAAFGDAPGGRPWCVGLDDLARYGEAAPIHGEVRLSNAALATSGRGPRDFKINGEYASATLSPHTGAPASANISANVLAPSAMTADALATALLVMPAKEGLAQLAAWPNVAARVVDADGRERRTDSWFELAQAKPAAKALPARPAAPVSAAKPSAGSAKPAAASGALAAIAPGQRWPADWTLFIDYAAPASGSSFFMAAWISDARTKKPVRTLVLIGREAKWQKDNFVWWGNYKVNAEHMVDVRAQSTTRSGEYPTYWAGVDDAFHPMPLGDYILNIETSREHGDHVLFSTPVKIGTERFDVSIPPGPTGSVTLRYRPYNER